MPSLIVGLPSNDESNLTPMSIEGVSEKISSGAKIGKVQQTQGAEAYESGALIGEVQQSFGQYIGAEGEKLLKQGVNNMDRAIYNMVQANAMKSYNKEAQNKINSELSPSDDPATNVKKATKLQNPDAIASDLNDISDITKKTFSPAIVNPAYKDKFNDTLTDLNENHKVLSRGLQRDSQLQLSQKALGEGIQADIQSGILDNPENLSFYAQQGLDRIQQELSAGTISLDQASKLGDTLRKGLYLGSLSSLNKKDPAMAAEILHNKSPEELNLTDVEYKQLLQQNNASMKDVLALNKNQYQAKNEIDNMQKRLYLGSLEDGVKNNAINAVQIQEAYDNGKIGFEDYTKLVSSYSRTREKVDKTWIQRQEISAAISNGDLLANFDKKQISDHYSNSLKNLSNDGTGSDVDINTKIYLAKHYKGPVNALEKDIEYSLGSGNPEKIKEAVFAYNELQRLNPLALSGIDDKKTLAYLASLSNAYKYTTDGLTEKNIQKIHDNIYNIDTKTKKSREKEFVDIGAFSDSGIENTIAEMYDDGDPWYRARDQMSLDIVNMIKPLLKEAYMETGNKADAIELVANKTKALVGHTNVNTLPKWGLDAGSIIAIPPESIYKASAEEIRHAINKEIAEELPKGVLPNQVLIGSDDLTIRQFQQGQKPSYYLYFKDKQGNDVVLPQRWRMDNISLNHISQKRLDIGNISVSDAAKKSLSPLGSEPALDNTILQNKNKFVMNAILSNTKQYNKNPILSEEFIDKISKEAYLPQIASKYPGAKETQLVVSTSLKSMLGEDLDSWRVGQSVKLINSVLVKNAEPSTYLKYGTVTTQPASGDIVVGKNDVGLFSGYRNIDGKSMVQYTSLKEGRLQLSLLPASEVKGYRKLPTPENFYKQSAPLNINNSIGQLNPYSMSVDRIPTGQEQWNIYNMTTSLKDLDKEPEKTIIDPATGNMVNLEFDYKGKLNAMKESQTNEKKSVKKSVSSAPMSTVDTSIDVNVGSGQAEEKNLEVVKYPEEGDIVILDNGSQDIFSMYQNDEVRLKSGKSVKKNKVRSFRRKKKEEKDDKE